jgi:hypothetical protein
MFYSYDASMNFNQSLMGVTATDNLELPNKFCAGGIQENSINLFGPLTAVNLLCSAREIRKSNLSLSPVISLNNF